MPNRTANALRKTEVFQGKLLLNGQTRLFSFTLILPYYFIRIHLFKETYLQAREPFRTPGSQGYKLKR